MGNQYSMVDFNRNSMKNLSIFGLFTLALKIGIYGKLNAYQKGIVAFYGTPNFFIYISPSSYKHMLKPK